MAGDMAETPSKGSEKKALVPKDKFSCLFHLPLFNVIYDLLFDEAPSISQCNDCMTTLALVSGLVVSVAQAVLNSVPREESDDFKTSLPVDYDKFVLQAAMGFNGIFASVLVCVIYFLAVSCTGFHTDPATEKVATAAWWGWTRWVIILDIGLIVVGAMGTVIAAGHVFGYQHMVFDEDTQEWSAGYAGSLFRILCFVCLAGLGVVIPLLLLSGGLSSAKRRVGVYNRRARELTVSADVAYTQLEAYEKDVPDQSFVHMNRDTFMERVLEAAGGGPDDEINAMSTRLTDAIFEHYIEQKIRSVLRAPSASGAKVGI